MKRHHDKTQYICEKKHGMDGMHVEGCFWFVGTIHDEGNSNSSIAKINGRWDVPGRWKPDYALGVVSLTVRRMCREV